MKLIKAIKICGSSETNSTVKSKEGLRAGRFRMLIDSIKNMPTLLNLTRLGSIQSTMQESLSGYDKATDDNIGDSAEKFLDLIAGLWKQAGA